MMILFAYRHLIFDCCKHDLVYRPLSYGVSSVTCYSDGSLLSNRERRS